MMDIRVEVEDLSSVKKKLTVEVSADAALQEFRKIAGKFRGAVSLPGFRRGKAPLAIVKNRFKQEIEEELYGQIVPLATRDALDQQDFDAVGEPSYGELQYMEGKPLSFWLEVEVKPEFSTPNYRGLKVTAPVIEVSDEDVANELERLRDRYASLSPVEGRSAEEGDYATVDLTGRFLPVGEEDQPERGDPASIDQEDYSIVVGGENTHPSFTRALVGMRLGEQEEFEVEYDGDHSDQRLAGRKVGYRLQLKELKVKELPELDDDFVADLDLGEELSTLEDLRQRVRSRLQEAAKEQRTAQIRNELRGQLVGGVTFDVPESMVENRIDRHVSQMAYNMVGQGVNPEKVPIDWQRLRREVRPEAERDVKLALILSRIAEAEGLQAQQADVDAEIEAMAASSRQAADKVRERLEEEGGMEGLRLQIARRKAMQFVEEGAAVAE